MYDKLEKLMNDIYKLGVRAIEMDDPKLYQRMKMMLKQLETGLITHIDRLEELEKNKETKTHF